MTKMVLSASVLPNTTGRVLHEFALWVDSIVHLMRQCTSRRSSMELQDSSALSRVSSTGTVRPSILQGRRLFKLDGPAIDDGYVSLRHIGRGRATTFGHRSSAAVLGQLARDHRSRRARNGRQGIGVVLDHAVPAFDPILGPRSQKLSRIGANGFRVLRLRVPCLHDAGSCSLQRPAAEKRQLSMFGRVPRYKVDSGGPGEPSGATRDPRGRPGRPPECPLSASPTSAGESLCEY